MQQRSMSHTVCAVIIKFRPTVNHIEIEEWLYLKAKTAHFTSLRTTTVSEVQTSHFFLHLYNRKASYEAEGFF